jgi:hypothetical protein
MAYAFRLRALDVNNQPELWPDGEAAETAVLLHGTCVPDTSEPDDDIHQARALPLGETTQRNLCGAGDPDWFYTDIVKEGRYFITGLSQNGGAAVNITIYAEDGTTVVAGGAAGGIGQNAVVRFQPDAPGRYYIIVNPLTENLMGTDAVYGIAVLESKEIFLPIVVR